MNVTKLENRLPTLYTQDVIRKSNLLLQAEVALGYKQFGEAADLFLESAEIEAQLAKIAEQYARHDRALVHFVSEMSCLAQADETSRAIKRGEQILTLPYLTDSMRDFVTDYVEQLEARRYEWMRAAFERSLTEYV